MKTNTKPVEKRRYFKMCESWDKDPDKNMGKYLAPEAQYIALRKYFTGSEFVQWFVETRDTRFNWLLRLWVRLNV